MCSVPAAYITQMDILNVNIRVYQGKSSKQDPKDPASLVKACKIQTHLDAASKL